MKREKRPVNNQSLLTATVPPSQKCGSLFSAFAWIKWCCRKWKWPARQKASRWVILL